MLPHTHTRLTACALKNSTRVWVCACAKEAPSFHKCEEFRKESPTYLTQKKNHHFPFWKRLLNWQFNTWSFLTSSDRAFIYPPNPTRQQFVPTFIHKPCGDVILVHWNTKRALCSRTTFSPKICVNLIYIQKQRTIQIITHQTETSQDSKKHKKTAGLSNISMVNSAGKKFVQTEMKWTFYLAHLGLQINWKSKILNLHACLHESPYKMPYCSMLVRHEQE